MRYLICVAEALTDVLEASIVNLSRLPDMAEITTIEEHSEKSALRLIKV